MTEIPTTEPVVVSAEEEAAFAVMSTDAVLTGRAMSSGQVLAGLVALGQLETVGGPEKRRAVLFPGVDPVGVERVWERAWAVGGRAGRVAAAALWCRERVRPVGG